MKNTTLKSILVCGVLLIFIIVDCQVVSASDESAGVKRLDRYALVFFDSSKIRVQSELLSGPNIAVLENYGSFVLVRVTDAYIALLRNNNIIVQVLSDIGRIKFDTVSFDTLSGEPNIPPEFRAREPAMNEGGYYIVQMKGPPRQEWLDSLKKSDCRILDVVNYYAYLVKMTPLTMNLLKQQDFITWVGLYHPFYKLRCNVEKARGQTEVNVMFFKDGNFHASINSLKGSGGEILFSSNDDNWWSYARVKIDSSKLPAIAALSDCWFIEPSQSFMPSDLSIPTLPHALPPGNEIENDIAKWVIQSGIAGSTPIWDHGLHGEGIIVGVGDTGCDYDHNVFTDSIGVQGVPSPSHRKIVRYWPLADTWDHNGHGTHVAGSIAGNNVTNPGTYNTNDGMAYMARLSVDNIMNNLGSISPLLDLEKMFYYSESNGSMSHSNSWGFGDQGLYDSWAQKADQYLWDHPYFLALFAAGNHGKAPKVTSSPGTAKNIVTVGACVNGNSEDIALFSSRGPTEDGVIKPDVVAPGANIISALGDGLQNSYNNGYHEMSGTSMATPMVAGADALVQQYFIEGFYPSGVKNPADSFIPSGPLRKAILVNSGKDMLNADAHIPDNSQGWGRITLDNSLYFKGDPRYLWLHDEYKNGSGLKTGEKYSTKLNVGSSQEFRATLVWNDYPGHGLKNDLNLVVTAPNGTKYVGNNFQNGESVPDAGAQPDSNNSVECVYVKSPQNGEYLLEVTAASISSGGSQNFSMVVTGALNLNLYGIILNTPKTGTTVNGGTNYGINWTTYGGTTPITVEILWSNDSGAIYTSLVNSQPPTGEWLWNVPAISINTARVRVIATDKNSNITQAESGDFTVTTSTVPERLPLPIFLGFIASLIAVPALVKQKMERMDNYPFIKNGTTGRRDGARGRRENE